MFKNYDLDAWLGTEDSKIYSDDTDITVEVYMATAPDGTDKKLYEVAYNDNGYTVTKRYSRKADALKAFRAMQKEYEATGDVAE